MHMIVKTRTIQINTKGEDDMIDVTSHTAAAIKESEIKNGITTIFVSGSTAAVTTIEFEPGLKHDFPQMLSRVAPQAEKYEHDNAWHDGNGHSHVRASLVGPSLTVPFKNFNLLLGIWQQIVILEMDMFTESSTSMYAA
jgi:secondary thiamine-phosphate synthase enzyme